MATRAQAKIAVNNAATTINAEIDNLPSNVNIVDGLITFNPTRALIKMDGGNNSATTLALVNAIIAFLNSQTRTFSLTINRRSLDGEVSILISTAATDFKITNFPKTYPN